MRRPARPAGPTAPSLAALVIVTGVGPLALDTYLPALPSMQRSLHSTASVVQLTVTAYIVGLALGQLVAGPISDSVGRRGILLGSTGCFLIASLGCAVAPSAPVMVAIRLVHGTVAGGGVSVERAVVSDHYQGDAAARRYGTISSITFLGPVIAPALGSAILAVGSWRTIFLFLTGLGAVMVLAVQFGLPETLPPADRQHSGLRPTWARTADLLADRAFLRHTIVQCLATMGFFTYIGGSTFVLQTVYGISQSNYAAVFTVNAAAMVVTGVLFRQNVTRLGAERLRLVAVIVTSACSGLLLVVALIGHQRLPWLAVPWVLLCLVTGGMGLIIPASVTLAQRAGARSRGTASALQGGLSFLAGALVTPLTGVLGYHSLLPMAALMAGFMALTLAFMAVTGGQVWLTEQPIDPVPEGESAAYSTPR